MRTHRKRDAMNQKPIRLTVINHMKQPRERNQPCLCGSGKKFNSCCWNRRQTTILNGINRKCELVELESENGVQA